MSEAIHVHQFGCANFTVLNEEWTIKRRNAKNGVLDVNQSGYPINNYHIAGMDVT